MAMDLAARLKGANKLWKTAKGRVAEQSAQFAEYEDGKYLMRCIGLSLGESQNGRFQADFTWRFEEGDYNGKTKHNYQGLESEDGWVFFGRDIERLGYEAPESWTPDVVEAIAKDIAKTKPLCRVVLKTKGEFQNLYINKLLAGAGSDEEEEVVEEPEAEAEETEAEAEEEETESEEEEESEPEEEEEEEAEAEEEEEEEEEAEDEETVDIQPGMAVVVTTEKGEKEGKIVEVLAKEGKVRVKTEDGKVLRVGVDKIEVVAEEAPEEPPVKKAAAKKAAPAPAPAKKAAPAPVTKKGKK